MKFGYWLPAVEMKRFSMEKQKIYPVLEGSSLFRRNELIYINKSHELPEYCDKMHKHDFIEIAYVSSGNGYHQVGDYRYQVAKGDLFLINYQIPHGFFSSPPPGAPLVLFNCVFRPEFLDASLFRSAYFEDIATSYLFESLFPEDYSPSPTLNLQGVEFHLIGDLFQKMYHEYKLAQKGYSDLIRAYLIELIVKIMRLMEPSERRQIPPRHQELVAKAIDYLRRNYSSDIRLEDLAIHSFLSKNYFSKLFKEVAGISFSEYIQRLRMDEARHLLLDTDQKVADIAFQVGFNDLKFFYEVFKRTTGKTPGDYRKKP
jgi:AraC family L-rhamnose operon transcriptional activator RhaR